MRLLSYNIKSCLLRGLDAVAAAVAEHESDLVALQEVDRGTARAGGLDQSAELAARLGLEHHAFGAATPWPGGGEYGVALLARWPLERRLVHSVYTPTDAATPASEREPRALLSATVRAPAGAVRVLVTHLGLSSAQRAVQARELAAAARQAAALLPTLLLGDLNAPPAADELAPLRAALRDAHDALPAAERGTFPADAPPSEAMVTDYILVSGDVRVRSARIAPDVARASDHHLVLAEIALGDGAAR